MYQAVRVLKGFRSPCVAILKRLLRPAVATDMDRSACGGGLPILLTLKLRFRLPLALLFLLCLLLELLHLLGFLEFALALNLLLAGLVQRGLCLGLLALRT